jgi:hypothetical protein
MDENVLTPEESLLLITKTIEETKQRFKENGHIIIFWGIIIFTVFASQYIFSFTGLYKKFDIIWTTILFPLGAIYTFIYFRKHINKSNLPQTVITRLFGIIGWTVGMNLMVLGILFSHQLGTAMAPIFIILLALNIIVIGAAIKFNPLLIGGILLNLVGLGTFFIDMKYHGFSLMIGAVVGFIIPGILLNKARRNEHV